MDCKLPYIVYMTFAYLSSITASSVNEPQQLFIVLHPYHGVSSSLQRWFPIPLMHSIIHHNYTYTSPHPYPPEKVLCPKLTYVTSFKKPSLMSSDVNLYKYKWWQSNYKRRQERWDRKKRRKNTYQRKDRLGEKGPEENSFWKHASETQEEP